MTPKFAKEDRVLVNDPSLDLLREIMKNAGEDPKPNHHGIINEVWADTSPITYLVQFPDGQVAPYPESMIELRDDE